VEEPVRWPWLLPGVAVALTDTGEFLAVLVRATSNGYSTLWLAEAAGGIGGSVTTVESAEYKLGLASAKCAAEVTDRGQRNVARERVGSVIAQVRADSRFATCVIPVGNGEFLAVKTQ
jgi:predicted O-methyltransferase YrrM